MNDVLASVHEKVSAALDQCYMPEFSIEGACCDTPHGVATTLWLRNLTGNRSGERDWSGHAFVSVLPWAKSSERLDEDILAAAHTLLPQLGFYRTDYNIQYQGNNLNSL